jgi:hypothetical protein
MSVTAPPIVRYELLTLLVPDEGSSPMPLAATVPAPCCLLCEKPSHLPPAKTVWISAAGDEALGVICGPCNGSDDAELEARILAKVSGAPKVDAPPAAADPKAHIGLKAMAAADPAPAKWVTAAAREWVQPAA